MPYNDDKRIDLAVPFLQEGTALFLGDDLDSGRGRHSWEGFKLLHLSDLVASLTPDLRQYLFPGADAALSADALCQRIRDLAGIGEQTGLLFRKDGVLYFHPLPESETFVPDIAPMVQEQERRCAELSRKCRGRKRSVPEFHDILYGAEEEDTISFSITGVEEAAGAAKAPAAAAAAEEMPDPRVQAILEAWDAIERKFGITIEDLQILLGYKVKLSRLSISTAGSIFLADFDNREVKMDDLTKALYFFYLRHPEGARLKELQEHEEEIRRIYSGLTGRDDPQQIRESVHNLLNPYGNALNVSLSRIKRAFRNVVDDRVARFYYLSGASGETRKIPLDRDLVIWEH